MLSEYIAAGFTIMPPETMMLLLAGAGAGDGGGGNGESIFGIWGEFEA
jgi:hypothetical protein